MDATVATGAAAMMAIRVLLDHDVPEENILLVSLLMAESGMQRRFDFISKNMLRCICINYFQGCTQLRTHFLKCASSHQPLTQKLTKSSMFYLESVTLVIDISALNQKNTYPVSKVLSLKYLKFC